MEIIDFEAFWKLYPLKVKRKAAFVAFNKMPAEVTIEELLAGVKRYISYLKANTWLSPAHASTWLNQERWTDELPQPQDDSTSWKLNRALEETMRRRMQ